MPPTPKAALAVPAEAAGALDPPEYPHRPVTITVDGEDISKPRAVHVMSMAEVDRDREARRLRAIEVSVEPVAQPSPPPALPAVDTSVALRAAARAVNAARTNLECLVERLVALDEKYRDLGELQRILTAARDRRAQLLANALIAGKKASLEDIDKQCDVAARALERRADELTAVTRALQTLQAQRDQAQSTLAQLEVEYKVVRAQQVGEIAEGRRVAAKFRASTIAAQTCIAQLPAQFAAHLPKVDLDVQLAAARAIEDLVSAQADAELLQADNVAAIADQPFQPSRFLGCVWADGTVHPEPEPAPKVVEGNQHPVGLVTNLTQGAIAS